MYCAIDLELACILPPCGCRGPGPRVRGQARREVPSRVCFTHATWHLINAVTIPQRVAELARMRDLYGEARQHERLMRVVAQGLGLHARQLFAPTQRA